MSILTSVSGAKYPAVVFKSPGDSVAGRIVGHEDYQETDFDTKQPKTYKNSGDPVMGVRVFLETVPGDEDSRVTLWCQGKKMLQAVAGAIRGAGGTDLEEGADLAVTMTGYDGRAKTYGSAYSRPEAAETDKAPF